MKNLEKTRTNNFASGFLPDFLVDLAQNPLNPRTNGWEPFKNCLKDGQALAPEDASNSAVAAALGVNACMHAERPT